MQQAQIDLLVLAFQQGEKRAYSLLYQYFTPGLRRFAGYRVSSQAVADDLVQNVWIKVARRVHKLNDVRVFQSWLYRALRWEISDWRKSAAEQRHAGDDALADIAADGQSEPERIPRLLEALKPEEREIVELFYLHEFSLQAISLTLELPLGTVKSRLHRARQQLQTFYSEGD
ncbi:hypothetical protein IDSA_08440 [Pseudidiomarina salinarum]|uniref:Uncharacterized protein n=1 Tax=Pseudidiomarina salinarum TaxID=435908 RepID=A0A094ITU6_9GAMM|nr:RNA polymerase sigma factor [Pseudidiomarina salinarum]KFZ30557.1 hypothetical protein IDSA_08440 [Pseudidiomarina salinarum]